LSENESQSTQDERPARPRRRQFRRYRRQPRVCQFCAEKTKTIDHKQVELLKRYVKDQAKIRPTRETGACSKHQRMVAKAVKRARHLALLPFAAERQR
jgi:small subunit ribosomal protein S18